MLRKLGELFGCDARSLALFRMAIAALLIVSVIDRAPHLKVFYSDAGLFPKSLAVQESPFGWSLNYLSGAVWFQQVVFALLVVSALLLGIGLFTRVATIACWVLLVSIHVRNPMVLIGGDTLMRMMLFWSMWIPLGKSWSIDSMWRARRLAESEEPKASRAGDKDRHWVASFGTAFLILQICIMYWCAGLSKLTDPWLQGNAMEYVLRLEIYCRPLGTWVLTQPLLLKLITYSTLFVELLVPFLLFVPWKNGWFRLGVVAAFWSLHIGIDLCLDVGMFGIISMAAWLIFIPSFCWDRRKAAFHQQGWSRPGNLIGAQGAETSTKNQTLARVWIKRLGNGLAVFFMVYIIIWNAVSLEFSGKSNWSKKLPERFYRLGWYTMVAQNFQMFGDPPRFNPWFVYFARLRNGDEVDLLCKRPVDYSRPDASARQYASGRWKKLHRFLLRHDAHSDFHQSILNFFVREWNENHSADLQVTEARIEVYFEEIGPDYQAGDFIKAQNLATWETDEEDLDDQDLEQDVESFFKQLDSGSLIDLQ